MFTHSYKFFYIHFEITIYHFGIKVILLIRREIDKSKLKL